MIVLKFGGSALCDASSFLLCAQKAVAAPAPCGIVVSAMRGITHMLLELCLQGPKADTQPFIEHHESVLRFIAQDHPPFAEHLAELQEVISDRALLIQGQLPSCPSAPQHQAEVLSQGEWLSAHIMHRLLHSLGASFSLLDPRQFIRTQGPSTHAEVVIPDTMNRLMELRDNPQGRYLIPGFFGGNHVSHQTSLLGPNSSDYSGALLCAGFGAFGYEIWKDIDGIFEYDPKIKAHSQFKKRLSYQEIIDNAEQFSQVIHPCVAPLLQPLGTPIFVRNIFRPDVAGSIIADQEFSFQKDR